MLKEDEEVRRRERVAVARIKQLEDRIAELETADGNAVFRLGYAIGVVHKHIKAADGPVLVALNRVHDELWTAFRTRFGTEPDREAIVDVSDVGGAT